MNWFSRKSKKQNDASKGSIVSDSDAPTKNSVDNSKTTNLNISFGSWWRGKHSKKSERDKLMCKNHNCSSVLTIDEIIYGEEHIIFWQEFAAILSTLLADLRAALNETVDMFYMQLYKSDIFYYFKTTEEKSYLINSFNSDFYACFTRIKEHLDDLQGLITNHSIITPKSMSSKLTNSLHQIERLAFQLNHSLREYTLANFVTLSNTDASSDQKPTCGTLAHQMAEQKKLFPFYQIAVSKIKYLSSLQN